MVANMLLYQHTPSLGKFTHKQERIILEKVLASLSAQEAVKVRDWYHKQYGFVDMCHQYPDNNTCKEAALQLNRGTKIQCGNAWGLFNRSLSHA